MTSSSTCRPDPARWPRPGSRAARRGRAWAATLAAALAVPLAIAAQAGPARAAQPAPAALIAVGMPSYGVGGVPPISVGYLAQTSQAVAVDPNTGTVFALDAAGTLQVISEATQSVEVSGGLNIGGPGYDPTALGVDPVSGTVYVAEAGPPPQVLAVTENPSNQSADTVTAVTVPTGTEGFGGPEGIGVLPGATPDTGTVYVANPPGNTVSVISEATNSVTNVIPLPPENGNDAEPDAIAVDPTTGYVFVADSGDGYVSVLSGASYLGSFALPSPYNNVDPNAIAVDPSTGTIYVTTPEGAASSGIAGEMFVIQEDTTNPVDSTVAATIAIPPYGTSGSTVGVPESVAVNPNTATVYVTNEEGSVDVINEDTADPANDAISYTIGVGGGGYESIYGVAADTSAGNAYSGEVYADSNQTGDLYPILPQAISFTAPSCPSPGCEIGQTSTLTATGGTSGNPVVFSVPSSASSVCSVSGTNGTTLTYNAVGTCVVDANQANSNYYLAAPQISAGITVLPSKKQTIKWTPPSTTYYGPDTGMYGATVTLKATATSGLPVVFTVDPTTPSGICNTSGTNGTTLTYTNLGTCTIDANQAGNSTYLPAPQVQASITVDPATQTITFKPPATGLVGKSATLTATGGGSGNPVVFNVDPSTSPGVCSLSPPNGTNSQTVTYTAVGDCVIDANQAGSQPANDYLPAPTVVGVITVGIAPTFLQASPPLSAAPGSAYNYTFVASGIDPPTYTLSANAPAWLSINATTGQVSGTVPGASSPAPVYTYSVTATNKYGTATTSRFVALPPPSGLATAQVSSTIGCSTVFAPTCTLTVTNNGPAAQVIVSVVLPDPLYMNPSQPCPVSWGCFFEANTLTWSLGSMAAEGSASVTFGLQQSALCPSSGCVVQAVADTPSLDNMDTGYSTSSAG